MQDERHRLGQIMQDHSSPILQKTFYLYCWRFNTFKWCSSTSETDFRNLHREEVQLVFHHRCSPSKMCFRGKTKSTRLRKEYLVNSSLKIIKKLCIHCIQLSWSAKNHFCYLHRSECPVVFKAKRQKEIKRVALGLDMLLKRNREDEKIQKTHES